MAKFKPIPAPEHGELAIHGSRDPEERFRAISDAYDTQIKYWAARKLQASRDLAFDRFILAEQLGGAAVNLIHSLAEGEDPEGQRSFEIIEEIEGFTALALLTRKFQPTLLRLGVTDGQAARRVNFIPEAAFYNENGDAVPAAEPRLHISMHPVLDAEHFEVPTHGGSPSGWWRAGNLVVRRVTPAEISPDMLQYAATVKATIEPGLQTLYPYLTNIGV